MTDTRPAAFLSYVRADDQHEGGLITRFRERLSAEVRMQTGREFRIFQDRDHISWGENWQARIDKTLDAVTLLIPIITPSFFESRACRREVRRFLERERSLGRDDLILPVYYVGTPLMDDPDLRETDEVAKALGTRQYIDWRELRFDELHSKPCRVALAELARQVRDALAQRSHPRRPQMKAVGQRGLQYRAFWSQFLDRVRGEHPDWTSARTPPTDNWITMPSPIRGTRYGVNFASGGRLRVELYVDSGDGGENERLFRALESRRTHIEEVYGKELSWEDLPDRRACRIADYGSGDVANINSHEEYINWFFDSSTRLRNAITSVAGSLDETRSDTQ
jgi:Domain of unknown function (DUF4268)/TIR domain